MGNKVMREHFLDRFSSKSGLDFRLIPDLPASLNIELNSTCNQKCVFCAYHSDHATHGLGAHVMDFKLVTQILDEAWRIGIGRKEVGFYACGEPFLYKKLAEAIAYAKKKGFPYTFITSNGSVATPDRLKAVVDAGLDSIRFSVNACNPEQYKAIHGRDDFDKVREHIKFLSEYRKESGSNIAISISCVITQKTNGIQDSVYEQFHNFVDDIIFLPVLVIPDMRDQLADYMFEKDKNAPVNEDFVCKSVFDGMYIDAKGDVLVCCQGYGEKDAIAYQLNDNIDLEKAWESPVYQKYRKIFLDRAGLKGTICEHCYLPLREGEGFFQE